MSAGTSKPEKGAEPRTPAAAPARTQVLPAVRALARKLDVDLNLVQATGPGGVITRADVERAAKSLVEAGPAEPLRGMRRAMAQRMAAAHAEVVRTTVTDGTGYYVFTALTPGQYDLVVELQGFKKFMQSGVPMDAAASLRVDATLQTGTINESVTLMVEVKTPGVMLLPLPVASGIGAAVVVP